VEESQIGIVHVDVEVETGRVAHPSRSDGWGSDDRLPKARGKADWSPKWAEVRLETGAGQSLPADHDLAPRRGAGLAVE